jgi:hypothetical protein
MNCLGTFDYGLRPRQHAQGNAQTLNSYSHTFKYYRIMGWASLVERMGGDANCRAMLGDFEDWLEAIVRSTFGDLERKMAAAHVYLRTICNTTTR